MSGDLFFGGAFEQKLLFVPNADTNPENEHEISDPTLFQYLIDGEKLRQLTDSTEIPEMLNALSDIDKLSIITEFETHQNSIDLMKDLIKAFHVFIVFKTTSKTNGDYWWSLEKNLDYIVLQRSRNKKDVKDKCYGEERNNVKPIKENLKGKGTIRNLFAILWVHKIIEEKYHIMNSNCQSLVTLVSKQITEIGYEYEGYFKFSLRENERNTEMLDCINLLTNAFDNQNLISTLIQHENTKLFDVVIESGKYDIDDPIILDGSTPLNLAIAFSKTKMVQHLLDKWNADPTKSGYMGINVLTLAIKVANENMDIIDLLLAHEKVDIDEREELTGWTALHWAVLINNPITVKHLLDKEANPNISATKGGSPLHFAARYGMGTEIIDLILKAKNHQEIDYVDDQFGLTALHMAAFASNEKTAQYLIEQGADINYRDKFGHTPLHLAAEMTANLKFINLLLENIKEEDVDQYNKDDEILTCAKGNLNGLEDEIIDRLHRKGITRIMTIDPVFSKETEINPPTNRAKQLETKLENLQIIESSDNWCRNVIETRQTGDFFTNDDVIKNFDMFKSFAKHAIISSCVGKSLDRLEKLYNAQMTWKEKEGINAINAASKCVKTTLLFDVVMETGKLNTNNGDNTGITPLHYAMKRANPTINARHSIKEKDADPEISENEQDIPQYRLVLTTREVIFDLILKDKKCAINERGKYGWTALHLAMMNSDVGLASCFIENGANPTVADENGWTPLHAAAKYANDMDIVELLLNHKDVDVNSLDNIGRNALDYAKDNVHGLGETIANRLKEKGAVEKIKNEPVDQIEKLKKLEKSQNNWSRNIRCMALSRQARKFNNLDTQVTNGDELKDMLQLALINAIINSDVEKIRRLTEDGTDISKVTWEEKKGLNALHAASYFTDRKELIDVILKNGQFDINGVDDDGQTPLHYAIKGDNPAINARHLIEEKGADPNISDKNGVTPLQLAAVAASLTEDTRILDLLLANENVNIDERDENGRTALHYAIIKSNVTTVRYLIEKGADPSIADEDGWTPLHAAVIYAKEMDIIELLLNHKDVIVNYFDNWGRNPLYYAKNTFFGIGETIADRLKEKGAVEVEAEPIRKHFHGKRTGGAGQIKDTSNDSQIKTERDEVDCIASEALHESIINSDVERVRILIVTGLDFSKPKWEENGMNALHLASKYAKKTELIDVILENGQFDINGGDNDGQTPLHYAIKGDNPTMNGRHLIEEKGADPNIPDKNEVTPLQLAAAEAKTMDLIDLFLNNEVVDVNHRDNQGSNALVHALLNEHGLRDRIIARLKERGV